MYFYKRKYYSQISSGHFVEFAPFDFAFILSLRGNSRSKIIEIMEDLKGHPCAKPAPHLVQRAEERRKRKKQKEKEKIIQKKLRERDLADLMRRGPYTKWKKELMRGATPRRNPHKAHNPHSCYYFLRKTTKCFQRKLCPLCALCGLCGWCSPLFSEANSFGVTGTISSPFSLEAAHSPGAGVPAAVTPASS
jgi:hypothetical protein